jgi:hypothetical protein
MKGENVLKVRKNVRSLWSAIEYARSHDENVLFRISLDVVVVEVALREGGGGGVWCKTALVPNQELFLNLTKRALSAYHDVRYIVETPEVYKHTLEIWTRATAVGPYCCYCLSRLMLCNSMDNALRPTINFFILAMH